MGIAILLPFCKFFGWIPEIIREEGLLKTLEIIPGSRTKKLQANSPPSIVAVFLLVISGAGSVTLVLLL